MARLLLVILLVATIASAVAVVHKRHQHRQLFVELSRLEQQRDIEGSLRVKIAGQVFHIPMEHAVNAQ